MDHGWELWVGRSPRLGRRFFAHVGKAKLVDDRWLRSHGTLTRSGKPWLGAVQSSDLPGSVFFAYVGKAKLVDDPAGDRIGRK